MSEVDSHKAKKCLFALTSSAHGRVGQISHFFLQIFIKLLHSLQIEAFDSLT